MQIADIIEIIIKALNNPVAKDRVSTIIWVIILTSAFVEFSRINFRPYTWLLKTIGKIMNSDIKESIRELDEKIDNIEKRQTQLEYEEELNEVLYARRRILRANDELLHDPESHSREFFNEIIADIQAYEQYCEAHKDPNDPQYFRNDKCTESIINIRRIYRELEAENKFL